MESALFFRNCKNYNELKKLTLNLPSYGQNLKYVIIKNIVLNENDFSILKKDFSKSYSFIKKWNNKIFMDKDDLVYCISVSSGSSPKILIYSAGYEYPRYVAIRN